MRPMTFAPDIAAALSRRAATCAGIPAAPARCRPARMPISIEAVSKPSGRPVSKRRPSNSYAKTGWISISDDSASVIWISRPFPGRRALDDAEDLRCQHIAPDDRQPRRRIVELRLLDQRIEPHDAIGRLLAAHDAVLLDLRVGHFLHGDDRAAVAFEHVDHLLRDRDLRQDHVVRKHQQERLIADDLLRLQHGVPDALLLLLAHVHDVREVADPLDLGEPGEVALLAERDLQLDRPVEVVLHGPLARAVTMQTCVIPAARPLRPCTG